MITTIDQLTLEQLKELEKEAGREVRLRKHVYPRLIITDKLTQAEADRRIELMAQIRLVLSILIDHRTGRQGDLFTDGQSVSQ